MPPTVAPFDEARAHRWFAVEANNLAWDLLALPDRSAADTQRMLHAAHAAAFHWSHVGQPINALRADVLLATAHHAAGRSAEALRYAEGGTALLRADVGATAFDRASVLAAGAAALAAVGQTAESAALLADARAAADQLDDAGDSAVLAQFYPAIRVTED